MTQGHKALKLQVRDMDDITVLSSLTQDSLLALCDVDFLKEDKSFVLILNRFCWEDIHEDESIGPYNRIHTALRFDGVNSVQIRQMNNKNLDEIHSLLTIAFDATENAIAFHFAGGGAIRLLMENMNCLAEDMGDSWPGQSLPAHTPK